MDGLVRAVAYGPGKVVYAPVGATDRIAISRPRIPD